MSALVDHQVAELREIPRRAGVALGPGLLRQRAVGDLADDVAAELPAPAVAHDQTVLDEGVDVGDVERLASSLANARSAATRPSTPRIEALSRIARCDPVN